MATTAARASADSDHRSRDRGRPSTLTLRVAGAGELPGRPPPPDQLAPHARSERPCALAKSSSPCLSSLSLALFRSTQANNPIVRQLPRSSSPTPRGPGPGRRSPEYASPRSYRDRRRTRGRDEHVAEERARQPHGDDVTDLRQVPEPLRLRQRAEQRHPPSRPQPMKSRCSTACTPSLLSAAS